MDRLAWFLGLAVVGIGTCAQAYEYRLRWVERVGDTDVVIGGNGATLDVRANPGPRRVRLEIGVFNDAMGPAAAGGLVGWRIGTLSVSGPAGNSQDRRTPGRIAPFNYPTVAGANGNPPPAGGVAGPDAEGFDFQILTDIDATLGLQSPAWGCDAGGHPLPWPSASTWGRNTFVPVYEITTDATDAGGRNYTITAAGNLVAAAEWRYVGEPSPPVCDLGIPGSITYAPFPTAPEPFSFRLRVIVCSDEPVIAQQPADTNGALGGEATFSVTATGGSPLTYQWRQGGIDLADGGRVSGANTGTLTIAQLGVADHGAIFSCVVTDACDSVTSGTATLRMCGVAEWSPLGSGMNTGAVVYAMAPLPGGGVVVGGNFSSAGGVPANRIARWDGTTWQPLGSGVSGDVYALAVLPGGDVVAAGAFASGIVRWHSGTWSSFGGGMNAAVQALALLPNGDLIAGGDFTLAGGQFCTRIARWDGTGWWRMGNGMNNTVRALTVMPNGDVVAGGAFSIAGSVFANRIARWNGTAWQPLDTGMNAGVRALAVLPGGDLVAGGEFTLAGATPGFYMARWDGVTWEPLGGGMNSWVNALAILPGGDLAAGGYFSSAGGSPAAHMARWDGTAWRTFSSGMNFGTLALTVTPGGELFAGGIFTIAGGAGANAAARWAVLVQPASVDSHPAGVALCPGGTTTFSVTARGDAPISYQWRKDGAALADEPGHLSGVTTPTLTLLNAGAGDAGSYDCIVANTCASVASDAATLVICATDFNCSGVVDSQDFFDFLTAFFGEAPGADFNRDGVINSQDFFDFLDLFVAGCGV